MTSVDTVVTSVSFGKRQSPSFNDFAKEGMNIQRLNVFTNDIEHSLRVLENETEKEWRRISDEIDAEKRFISCLEKDLPTKESRIKIKEEELRKTDYEIQQLNARLDFARNQTKSLIGAKAIFGTHVTEKYKKLEILLDTGERLKKQENEMLETYRKKWELYYKIYESSDSVRDFLKLKVEVMSIEEDLLNLEGSKKEIEERIKSRDKRSEEELITLVVDIAKLKFDTNGMLTRMAHDERINNKPKTPDSWSNESRSKVSSLFEQTDATPTPAVHDSPFTMLDNFRNFQFSSLGLKSRSKQIGITDQTLHDSRKIKARSELFDLKKFPMILTTFRKETEENKNPTNRNQTDRNVNLNDTRSPFEMQQPLQLQQGQLIHRESDRPEPQRIHHEVQRQSPQRGRDVELFQRDSNARFTPTPTATQSFRLNFGEQSAFNFGASSFGADDASRDPSDRPPAPPQFFSFFPQDDSSSTPNSDTTFKLFA